MLSRFGLRSFVMSDLPACCEMHLLIHWSHYRRMAAQSPLPF